MRCCHIYHRGTYLEPAEWCEEDAVPGSEYCPAHIEARDPDHERDIWREAGWL